VEADADTGEDFGVPADLSVGDDQQLEAPLLQRLADDRPSIEATPQYWADLRRRLAENRGGQSKDSR
jgi:hypothetical protein